eukprot:12929523-Prorocentrum_lima.AAC.1
MEFLNEADDAAKATDWILTIAESGVHCLYGHHKCHRTVVLQTPATCNVSWTTCRSWKKENKPH